MDEVFAVPALWLPSGTHGRVIGLSAVKTLTFGANEQGMYIQALTQNVRITLDGSTPAASGNDVGFELRAGDPAVLLTGQPGQSVKIIQEAASAIVQYQMLTLASRFTG